MVPKHGLFSHSYIVFTEILHIIALMLYYSYHDSVHQLQTPFVKVYPLVIVIEMITHSEQM